MLCAEFLDFSMHKTFTLTIGNFLMFNIFIQHMLPFNIVKLIHTLITVAGRRRLHLGALPD